MAIGPWDQLVSGSDDAACRHKAACNLEQKGNTIVPPRRSHAFLVRAIGVVSALVVLLAIAAMARPIWNLLVDLFAEPWPERGAAVMLFSNERPDDLWLLSLRVEEREHVPEWPPDQRGWVVRRPGELPRPFEFGVKLVSASAGRHTATIVYSVGGDRSRMSFSFEFELTPMTQCDVRIVFRGPGPEATPCLDPRPATYGGTWPH